MAGQSFEERLEAEEEVECARNHEWSQPLKRSDGGNGTRCFGNYPRIVCTYEKATVAVAAADRGKN
jgi:hypothetical protein